MRKIDTAAKSNENSTNTAMITQETAQNKKEIKSGHHKINNDEDEDSAEEVEKVEHYLESPEKEGHDATTQKTPSTSTETEVQKQEVAELLQENQPESYTAVCNLQLKNNKEIENNIMEEKIIEVIKCIPFFVIQGVLFLILGFLRKL